jgi:DNA-binding MurR/RpiR family transcriptional regulator
MDQFDASRNIVPVLKFLLPTLTKSEKRAAEYILNNLKSVSRMPLTDFAMVADCGQASVIRLCKRMGLSGYAELKEVLLKQISDNAQLKSKTVLINGNLGTSIREIMNNVFQVNIQILKDTLVLYNSAYEKALEALIHAKQIAFFAIGDAMTPCEYAMFKFRRLGYKCYADSDCDMQMINASNLKEGDVAIAISHSGNTRQVVDAMRVAHENGATTICITKREKSELIKYSNIKLFTATPDITVGQEIVARRVSEQVIMEALYFGVLQYNEEQNLMSIDKTSEALKNNKII